MPDECPSVKVPGQFIGALIGLCFIIGSMCLFAVVLLGYTKIEWKDIALVIVGALLNQCAIIIGKWYGASQSSERKTEAMVETSKLLASAKVAEDKEKPNG